MAGEERQKQRVQGKDKERDRVGGVVGSERLKQKEREIEGEKKSKSRKGGSRKEKEQRK